MWCLTRCLAWKKLFARLPGAPDNPELAAKQHLVHQGRDEWKAGLKELLAIS